MLNASPRLRLAFVPGTFCTLTTFIWVRFWNSSLISLCKVPSKQSIFGPQNAPKCISRDAKSNFPGIWAEISHMKYNRRQNLSWYLGQPWLPWVSTNVTIRTGKSYKRNPSTVVLQPLFLGFASKITNIITLIFQFLFIRDRPLPWQQNV